MAAANTVRKALHESQPLRCNTRRPAYVTGRLKLRPDRTATVLPLAEEGEFYVPDMLSDDAVGAELLSAADKRGRGLRKAWSHIGEARLLSEVLRASMSDDYDSRAMQVDTVLRIVEKKLGKAYAQIDRHDRSHHNLFVAYADLKKTLGQATRDDTVHR